MKKKSDYDLEYYQNTDFGDLYEKGRKEGTLIVGEGDTSR